MDELDECIHGLGPVAACTICNGRAKEERRLETTSWRKFPARYPSQCRECNLPIVEGQMVAWRPDRPAVHDGCEQ